MESFEFRFDFLVTFLTTAGTTKFGSIEECLFLTTAMMETSLFFQQELTREEVWELASNSLADGEGKLNLPTISIDSAVNRLKRHRGNAQIERGFDTIASLRA